MNTASVKNKLKKRVYTEVPVAIKRDAINKIERGIPFYDVAEELHVHHTTVRQWHKNRDNLIKQTSEIMKTKKRFRTSRQDNINRAVWIWFKQARNLGISITGPMIQSKALEFSLLFNNQETFTASNGWLRSWKKNFEISLKTLCDEKLSANIETVDAFKQKLVDYIEKEELTPHQVFNGAKSLLFYKLSPEIAFSEKKNESSADVKGCEEAVTVMACSNASGTCKLPLVIIGKSVNPLILEKVKPVSYKSHKRAWMTGDLFKSWFENEFVPVVKKHLKNSQLPCKALLVIDNYLSQNITLSKDGITVLFFSSYSTYSIQPMKKCLNFSKLLYKQRLMDYIIDSIDKQVSLIQAIENITVKEAIHWAAAAWNDVSAETIQKSWNQVWSWAGRIESCQVHSSQQRHIIHLYNNFCSRLEDLDTSNILNVSELDQWLNSNHDKEKEKLSDADIVEIIQDESQMNINETDKAIDPLNERSDDGKESTDNNHHHSYEFVEVKCDEDVEDLNEEDALLCVEYLREYCEKNNFMKSIAALDIIKGEIKR